MQANLDAFERWRIVPRMLRDVSERDLRRDGARHADAGAADARAGRRAVDRPPRGASSRARAPRPRWACPTSSAPPRRTRSSRSPRRWGRRSRWYQLYWPRERELAASFVARAEQAGYEAIVLTLDTWFLGWRPRDLQNAYLPFLKGEGVANYFSDPVFRAALREAARGGPGRRRSATGPTSSPTRPSRWDDLAWLREQTRAADRAQGHRPRRGRARARRSGRRRR